MNARARAVVGNITSTNQMQSESYTFGILWMRESRAASNALHGARVEKYCRQIHLRPRFCPGSGLYRVVRAEVRNPGFLKFRSVQNVSGGVPPTKRLSTRFSPARERRESRALVPSERGMDLRPSPLLVLSRPHLQLHRRLPTRKTPARWASPTRIESVKIYLMETN